MEPDSRLQEGASPPLIDLVFSSVEYLDTPGGGPSLVTDDSTM